jgi:hypothetical protein
MFRLILTGLLFALHRLAAAQPPSSAPEPPVKPTSGWQMAVFEQAQKAYRHPQGFSALTTSGGATYYRFETRLQNAWPRVQLFDAQGQLLTPDLELTSIDLIEGVAPNTALVCGVITRCRELRLPQAEVVRQHPYNRVELLRMSDRRIVVLGIQESNMGGHPYRLHLLDANLGSVKSEGAALGYDLVPNRKHGQLLRLRHGTGWRLYSVDLDPVSPDFEQPVVQGSVIWAAGQKENWIKRPYDGETFERLPMPQGIVGFRRDPDSNAYWTYWSTPQGDRISAETGPLGEPRPPHPELIDRHRGNVGAQTPIAALVVRHKDGLWRCQRLWADSARPFVCPSVPPQATHDDAMESLRKTIAADLNAGGPRRDRWLSRTERLADEARSCMLAAKASRGWEQGRECARLAGGLDYYGWMLEDPQASPSELQAAIADARQRNPNFVTGLQQRLQQREAELARAEQRASVERYTAMLAQREASEREYYRNLARKQSERLEFCRINPGDVSCRPPPDPFRSLKRIDWEQGVKSGVEYR